MKNFIQYGFSGLFLTLLFACSNDFLTETSNISNFIPTNIVVSPEWEAQDFEIYFPEAGNAGFTIENAPDWLRIESKSGQFQKGVATIRCSAVENSNFSQIGFYHVFMVLNVEKKGKCTVQVSYINEGNPRIETVNSINFSYNDQPSITVHNTGEGILIWKIVEIPEWLTVDFSSEQAYLLSPNSEGYVYFIFSMGFMPSENLSGKIKIRSNDKKQEELVVDVNVNFGNPVLHFYQNEIDFERTETSRVIEFSNQGNGILTWSFENCPEWLTFSEMSGTINPYTWINLTLTCNRDLLPAGEQSVVVNLKTNDKNNPVSITIKVRGSQSNSNYIVGIDGTIVDAWFDKTDLLYLATTKPNKLLAYDTQNHQIFREVNLSKAPTCFSVSEDGRKTIVGHGGMISSINMDNFSVTKTTEVEQYIFDIEWGADDWVCYTVGNGVQWTNIYWVNLLTNAREIGEQTYENCMIKKVPHKNYILGSEVNLSNGIYLFDINTRKRTTDIFNSFGYFWFSADATYIFDSWKHVYRTSTIVEQKNTSSIDQLTYNFNNATWIDHNTKTNSLWIVPSLYPFPYNTDAEVLQLEATDYTLVKTYNYDNYYRATNGIDYPVQARYVFVNSAGTELMVVKGVFNDYSPGNAWAIEHIPLTE
ncbi:hypothetical protein FACS1894123_02860 [Bacteroidia bacterium]|nr:hypothetical protein FACS1894123_02860 [Bacteroidia bacterium]